MIEFERYELANGLKVLLHHDPSTPMVVVNTLFDVGARDEDESKTGFAHLFEHLMFGGSVNIPDFDGPLQRAGGESNAFTSNDVTNYYNTLPKENIETALWLESDRMLSLAFTEKSLEVQRSVVIEEFKQRYLNQPYGNTWLELRPLAYTKHPYKWATIGKEIRHIEEATMEDVRAFFNKHYQPSNAILCIAGNFEGKETKALIDKYYSDIPGQAKALRKLPKEPLQKEFRQKDIYAQVPANSFHFAFKMCDRNHEDFYTTDVISDILGRDKSALLYLELKKKLQLVSEVSAYVMGSHDEGLFVISGKLGEGITFESLEKALFILINGFFKAEIHDYEMTKNLNKIRTSKEFQDQGLLSRAMNLSINELLGDANDINKEMDQYKRITKEEIKRVAKQVLRKDNCSLLRIHNQNKEA
jgi:zinc protease